MWHNVCAMCPRRRLMSAIGLMFGGRKAGEKWAQICPPPKHKKGGNREKCETLKNGKVEKVPQMDEDQWGNTLENKKHSNYKKEQNVCKEKIIGKMEKLWDLRKTES